MPGAKCQETKRRLKIIFLNLWRKMHCPMHLEHMFSNGVRMNPLRKRLIQSNISEQERTAQGGSHGGPWGQHPLLHLAEQEGKERAGLCPASLGLPAITASFSSGRIHGGCPSPSPPPCLSRRGGRRASSLGHPAFAAGGPIKATPLPSLPSV